MPDPLSVQQREALATKMTSRAFETVGHAAEFQNGVEWALACLSQGDEGERCDCGHDADAHENLRPDGRRVVDGQHTACAECACIDFVGESERACDLAEGQFVDASLQRPAWRSGWRAGVSFADARRSVRPVSSPEPTDEEVERAAKAAHESGQQRMADNSSLGEYRVTWEERSEEEQDAYREDSRAALAAARSEGDEGQ